AAALKRDQDYRGVLRDDGLLGGLPIVGAVINAPILDFAAPKTTPGRQQVRQLVLPDVRQRLNYLESYTTDRCTTCHVAIDDPEFARDRLARKLERSLPGINQALQRRGLDPFDPPRPPTLEGTDQALPVGAVTPHWEKLSEAQQDAYFDALLGLVNRYLKLVDRKTIDLGQPILAHPDLELFVSVKSPHPMAKMGCTVCHEGNPQETDFVLAAHSPGTHKVRERWEEEYFDRVLGIPTATFETIEHYWDRSMLLPKYTEAGCAKCHSQISDVARFEGERVGARINLGRHLFTSVGCINCHEVKALGEQRRVGPDLKHLAAKLTPGFVQQWVYFPKKFRPSTWMPHFFLQENNRAVSRTSVDPDPVLRTQTEVAAITKYLFAVSDPWQPLEKPAGVQGDPSRGRQLFRNVGCLACHANIAETGEAWITADLSEREGIDAETARHRYLGMTYEERVLYAMEHFATDEDTHLEPVSVRFDPEASYHRPTFTRFAPELSGIGSKVTFDWLYSWLIEPTRYAALTKMPSLRLTPAEAADLAAYLMTLKNYRFSQEAFELDASRKAMVDDLMFMLLSAQRSERRSRAIIRDEGGSLTEMLVALLASSPSLDRKSADALIRPMSLQDKKLMFLGNKTIAHYGCYTCHEIRGFETTTPVGTELSTWAEKPVSQLDFANYDHAFHKLREEKHDVYAYVYPLDAEGLNHWSPIDDRAAEEIAQTHAGFAKHKLLNPRIWDREKLKKPYDKLKMPNFYFTEKEAEALTTYLLSRIPPRVNDVLKIDYDGDLPGPIADGRNLTRELNCLGCHEIEDNVPTIQQYFRRTIADRLEFDSTNAPPSLWGEGAKVQHHWFHRFLQQVEPLRPWLQVRMPSFTLSGEQATTLVEYFAALSRRDADALARARAPIHEYIAERLQSASPGGRGGEVAPADFRQRAAGGDDGTGRPGDDWYVQGDLERPAAQLRRFAVERRLIRASQLDPLTVPPARLRDAYRSVLEKAEFMEKLYDVPYPFVEPPRPMAPNQAFDRGRSFLIDMGCLACHVLGSMLPGPATNTDEFVQRYRLDGVRGKGEVAVALVNNQPFAIGSVIDGHTLISAENVYSDSGDVQTTAVFEGPGPEGAAEKVLLVAASAPNLSLTYQRLRRTWVYQWMLEPGWIQPGTKMPQNFAGGTSPFEGDPAYPGTGSDHINMLVDYLFQAGAVNERAPLPKIVLSDESDEIDEDAGEEDFDD
ncbi:MAG: hypothetical protein ACE5EX_01470, partial [Phycisphaerae bacterium]